MKDSHRTQTVLRSITSGSAVACVLVPSLLRLIVVVAVLAACSADASDIGQADRRAPMTEQTAEQPPESATEPTAAPVETPIAAPVETPIENAVENACRVLGTDSWGDVQIELQFVREGEATDTISANYDLLDEQGTVFESKRALMLDVAPNELVRAPIDTFENLPAGSDTATCRLTEIVEFGYDPLPDPGGSCSLKEIDSAGDMQVEVLFTSPLQDDGSLSVSYALRSPDGARITNGIFELAVAGGNDEVEFVADSLQPVPDGLDPEDISCELLSVRP